MRTAYMGYFGDFGIIVEREGIGAALKAIAQMTRTPGFDLEIEKSEFGTQLEFLGVAIQCRFVGVI